MASSKKAENKKGFLGRLKEKLGKTRETFTTKVDALVMGKKEIDENLLKELEELLIMADLGVFTVNRLMDKVQKKIKRKEINQPDMIKGYLKEEIKNILLEQQKPLDVSSHKPFVIMVLGVNGTGKTTTIAKMAGIFKKEGKKVLLAAADTFRAAAIEQLEIWSEKVGCEIIKQKSGADPSAVVFDAINAARARDTDVLIVDTAGRFHTKVN